MGGYGEWRPYVPQHERKRRARKEADRRRKAGQETCPVAVRARLIARTFWGRAWCENLEHYSDYANRLPRGRTYVRNGSVFHLGIAAGEVEALVSGSEIYEVALEVEGLPPARWDSIRRDCAGGIDSLVELLQGRLSDAVMERICRPKEGLFPSPKEIRFSCSCPDWASMCKHVAAVLYGIGARLDEEPELLFLLRDVDAGELLAAAGAGTTLSPEGSAPANALADDDLSALFGVDLAPDGGEPAAPAGAGAAGRRKAPARKKTARKKKARKKKARKKKAPAKKKAAPKKKTARRSR